MLRTSLAVSFGLFLSTYVEGGRLIDNYYNDMNQYFGAKDDEGEMYDYDEGYEDLFDFDDEDYSALKDALDGYYDEEYYGDEYDADAYDDEADYYDGEYYDGDYYDDEDYNDDDYDGDYYDGEYDADYYDGDYYDGDYDDDYYGDEYYDGDYYYDDDEDYDEDLAEQIAALENYYDSLNMNQYQRAYNAKYMNLMNAYNQLLAESNLYTNNYYNQMGMGPGAASKASTNDVANAYSEYANEYYYWSHGMMRSCGHWHIKMEERNNGRWIQTWE